ncbi:unnamed protein product [Plutella xylostella]|uniref:(diamondback moth) hypothetical protein n=1 Tax=Plutella xylostella TaxID=51655 RepID=A0A8S4DC82_PLUXY|nr:unnamed protein product [Plutella xylostella]
MMYRMKKIITYDEEIPLPKCMYMIKPINDPIDSLNQDEEINISQQAPNKEMAELVTRQDQLLLKLDLLYEKIKAISSSCKTSSCQQIKSKQLKPDITPDEVVLTTNAENLPWYIHIILKKISTSVKIYWHIHSSVPTQKVPKIKSFVQTLQSASNNSGPVVRLIFVNDSADPELKLSSLSLPIVGNVNILRYLSLVFPNEIPYDNEDFTADALLDICHSQLERASEKNKETVVKKLFAEYDGWVYSKQFTIVDLAAFNVIKQWRNCPKYVPKEWFDKMSQL